MYLRILPLIVVLGVITSAFSAPPAPAKSTLVRKVIIHKRTSNFIDIEAPVDQVWVGCDRDGPKPDSISAMQFYVLDGDTAYGFYSRRVDDVSWCLKVQHDYRRMLRGAKTVRLVGIELHEESFNSNISSEERAPRRFTSASKTVASTYIRMQVGPLCKSHFTGDCKLPENYWGGIIPEPSNVPTGKPANSK